MRLAALQLTHLARAAKGLVKGLAHPPADAPRVALSGLRVTVALLLLVHGLARLALGIVGDFGVFLGAVGFPFGAALAWTVTAVEIVGGSLLAAGRWVRPLALYFAAQLLAGIALVHAAEGWFVVGAGRNGMEYSVLLVAVLAAVAYGSERQAPDGVGTRSGA